MRQRSTHEATVAPTRASRSAFLRGLCASVVKLFLAAREEFRNKVGKVGTALASPLDVFAFGGIDANLLTCIDEGRHLDHHAGLEGGGFGDVGC